MAVPVTPAQQQMLDQAIADWLKKTPEERLEIALQMNRMICDSVFLASRPSFIREQPRYPQPAPGASKEPQGGTSL